MLLSSPTPKDLRSQISNLKSMLLPLTLFMLRVGADHTHHAFAVDDLAVITHFFD
jgi:hypothetical protein